VYCSLTNINGTKQLCEISSSHGGEYEAQNLLGALIMEAACTSETSVDIQLGTWQYIPEDSEEQNDANFEIYIIGEILTLGVP
jgi:hypothetical protein